MASRKQLSPLDAALAESPPPTSSARRSVLEREDVHQCMVEWLDRKAAGEKVGTLTWFTEQVIGGKLGVKTGSSNVAGYMRDRFGDKYMKAMRG